QLILDPHAFPESHIILDFVRCGLGLRIEPGCVRIALAVDVEVVIARQSFPWTCGVLITWLKVLAPDCVGWKVLVAFDLDRFVALCQDRIFPDCFCHNSQLDSVAGSRLQHESRTIWALQWTFDGGNTASSRAVCAGCRGLER